MLGKRVRALRVGRGWRQEDLAHATGMQRSYVGGVERGERNIGFDNLLRLADALEVRVAELLHFDPDPPAAEEPSATVSLSDPTTTVASVAPPQVAPHRQAHTADVCGEPGSDPRQGI